jgi:hypothetical protein
LSLLDCTPLEHLGNSGHALPKGEKTMYSHRIVAKTFGVFFILTFLSYGIGTGLIDAIINTPDFLSHVYADKTTLVIGIILTGLVHSFMNIGLPVIMLLNVWLSLRRFSCDDHTGGWFHFLTAPFATERRVCESRCHSGTNN